MTLDLWLHIFASLSSNRFISRSSCLIRPVSPPWIAIFFAYFNCFLFVSKSQRTLPKHFLLHRVSSVAHLATLWITFVAHDLAILSFHTASTVSLHSLFDIHICSKRNDFRKLHSIPSGTIHKGLWSEDVTSRWWIFVLGKFENHSFVATTLSNLSHTV